MRPKVSQSSQTPAGAANTHQGVAVHGTATGEALSHPSITWVTL